MKESRSQTNQWNLLNTVTLTNYPIWDELAKLLAPIALNHLIKKHLESCNYKIRGNRDNNKFYKEIAFIHPISVVLDARGQKPGFLRKSFLLTRRLGKKPGFFGRSA